MLQAFEVACVVLPCLVVGWVVLRLAWKSPQVLLCMDCEQCGRACPVARRGGDGAVTPHDIMVAARAGLLDEVMERAGADCNLCGACQRLCPRGLAPYEEVRRWRNEHQVEEEGMPRSGAGRIATNGTRVAIGLLVLCLGPGVAHAQQQQDPSPPAKAEAIEALELGLAEELVVTANLTPSPAEQVGSAVTVIDRRTIEAVGARTVTDVLRMVPGLSAVQQGGAGRAVSVFLRGAAASQTLVMLDGVRLNDITSGQADLADIGVEEIERIEILRGPQSGLYGSEAIGGVINIVSRRPAPGTHGSAAIEGGSASTRSAEVSVNHGGERWTWRAAASRERLPGDSLAAAAAGDESLNPYRRTFAAASASVRLGEHARASFSARYTDASSHPDGFTLGVGPSPAPRFVQEHESQVVAASLEYRPMPKWTHVLRVGAARDTIEGDDPDSTVNTFAV